MTAIQFKSARIRFSSPNQLNREHLHSFESNGTATVISTYIRIESSLLFYDRSKRGHCLLSANRFEVIYVERSSLLQRVKTITYLKD